MRPCFVIYNQLKNSLSKISQRDSRIVIVFVTRKKDKDGVISVAYCTHHMFQMISGFFFVFTMYTYDKIHPWKVLTRINNYL